MQDEVCVCLSALLLCDTPAMRSCFRNIYLQGHRLNIFECSAFPKMVSKIRYKGNSFEDLAAAVSGQLIHQNLLSGDTKQTHTHVLDVCAEER